MSGNIDKEVLLGFIEEAQSYLPAIRQGLTAYQADPTHLDRLEEAHRHAHTIKGASSMVGLAGLSHMAYFIEETLEAIGSNELSMNDEVELWLEQILVQIENYLDDARHDNLHEAPLLAEITLAYRRLRGWPVEDDEVAVAEVLADVNDEPTQATLVDDLAQFMIEDDPTDDDFSTGEGDFALEDISIELMEAFYLEAEDHLRLITLSLAGLDKDPQQIDLLQNVRRSVHTLKGAAGTIGLQAMAELSHRMEDLLDRLYDGSMTLNADVMVLLLASSDALEDLTKGEVATETIQELYMGYEILLDSEQPAPIVEPLTDGNMIDLVTLSPQIQEEIVDHTVAAAADEAAVPLPTPPKKEEPIRPESSEVVRVPIKRLDELIKLVGELVITRTAFEQRMGNLIREVEELRPSVNRLRRVSTKLEVDYEASTLGKGVFDLSLASPGIPLKQNGGMLPAENLSYPATLQTHDFDELELDRYTEFHLLSRELAEATSDVNTIGNALNTLIGDFDSILTRQGRLSSELQEKLMRTRMVSLSSLTARLQRAVRVVAGKQNKPANLIIEGEHIELDKTVLEEMADPLLHILRNAVDHGLEPAALRQALGKTERGQILLHAYYEGNQVVIKISDDGAGLNPEMIRAKAVNNAYLTETEAEQLSLDEVYALLFLTGFSTANEISEISGRGVGLDVVKANVNKLKGTINLDSTPAQGTTFIIRLPMTLAVTRALLVKAHNETFAIPLNAITQILRLEESDFEQVGQESIIRLEGQVYPIVRLGEVLHLKQAADDAVERFPVLFLNAGDQQVALIVDFIVQGREVVIKSLGDHLRYVHTLMGATLMGDGSVVLILNPADLVKQPTQPQIKIPTPLLSPLLSPHKTWTIMVVDDSVSVRRIVSNMIKNAGWTPIKAKDGLEALEIIQRSAQPPDLILLDIEMPRMDGYELTAILQGQDLYQNIPIVMLTSRAGEKHRRKALELGVAEYMVKPYQDEALLTIIRKLVGEAQGIKAV